MAIEAARLTVVVDADIDRVTAGLGRVEDAIDRSGGIIRNAASTAFGYLSAQAVMGVGRTVGALFTLGLDTERAFNIFQGVTRASADTMQLVSQRAQELGADMSLPTTSARDAMLAMVELAKAGLSVEDSMNAARGSLQLAAAAGTDAAEAAQIQANILNAFSLSGADAGRVADMLAAAANSASGEIGDMAYAARQAAAVFGITNQSVDMMTTSIALMARQGIIGRQAGTSLKMMMMNLMAPTDQARTLMEKLGINVRDAAGEMRPMREIIAEFNRELAGIDAEERDKALRKIFGSDAIRAATILFGEGVEGFDAMNAKITEAGAAGAVAEARMQGMSGAIDRLISQVQTALISAFNAFAPVGAVFINWLAYQVPVAAGYVSAAFDAVRNAIGWLMDHTWALYGVLAGLGTLFLSITAVVLSMAAAVIAPMVAAALPFIAWAVAIGAVVAALVWAYQNVEGFRNVVDNVVEWVVGNWPRLVDALRNGMQWVGDRARELVGWWRANWDQIRDTTITVLTAIRDAVTVAFDWVMVRVTDFGNWWRTHWGDISEALRHIWNVMVDIVRFAIDVVVTIVRFAIDVITEIWDRFGGRLISIARDVWDTIYSVVEAAVRLVQGVIELTLAIINGEWGKAWDAILKIVGSVLDIIFTVVSNGMNILWNLVQIGLNSLWALFQLAFWRMMDVVRTAVDWIGDRLQNFFWDLPGVIAGAALDAGRAIAEALINGIRDGLGGLGNVIGNAFRGALGGLGPLGNIPGLASGGVGHGLTWVGEDGPELVNFGSPSRVHSNDESLRLLAGASSGGGGSGGGGRPQVVVNLNIGTVRDRRDIDYAGETLARVMTSRDVAVALRGSGRAA